MSLLDDAKKAERIPLSDSVTSEQIELAVAWAEESISTAACAKALNTKVPTALTQLARFLGAAIREGYLRRTTKMKNQENTNEPIA